MNIFKVLVDKKPKNCMFCPLKTSAVKIAEFECGKSKTEKGNDGWISTYFEPDKRCKFEEVK